MANTFTVEDSFRYGGPNTKRFLSKRGKLVIDTTANGGGAADDLPASMFGLHKIVDSSPAIRDGENGIYDTSPDYTGDSLLVKSTNSITLGDLPNDTYRITVIGY